MSPPGPRDVLDTFDFDDATKAMIRANVAAAPPLPDEARALIRRIWRDTTTDTEAAQTAKLLTTDEVAEELRMKPEGVRRLIRRKELPAMRVGRGYRIDPADVDAFKAARRI